PNADSCSGSRWFPGSRLMDDPRISEKSLRAVLRHSDGLLQPSPLFRSALLFPFPLLQHLRVDCFHLPVELSPHFFLRLSLDLPRPVIPVPDASDNQDERTNAARKT